MEEQAHAKPQKRKGADHHLGFEAKHLQMPMRRHKFSNAAQVCFFSLQGDHLFFCAYFLLILVSLCPTVSSSVNTEVIVLYSWLNSSPSYSSSSAFSSWNPQDSSPCKWSFVSCSSGNFVTEIDIESVELSLPFPHNLSSLKFLENLTISGANLTGTIPADIGDSVSLRKIDLSSNSLAGSIPSSIGKLEKLEELILSSNQLTGGIPPELGSCSSLKTLLLFDNRLSGGIPAELGNLTALETLRAGGNQGIEGEIPDDISKCSNLQVLGLAETKISGVIPSSLGKLKKLQVLSLYTTMLSGEIAPEIGNCSELVGLYLYENSLSGPIPQELGKLLKLEKLLLWQNNLVGPIPAEIGNCMNLAILDVSLNLLTGVIPEPFGNLTNLEELMISSNNVSGSIPSTISNASSLVQFQVDSNQISGFVPQELGLLTQLQVFFAWNNKLEGSIPPSLSGCKSLQTLDLSNNSLTGSLPPGIFQLTNLTKLLLIYNDLSGMIPAEIGNCKSLFRLRLAGNKISGQIPREIGSLTNLTFLDLSNNHLSGSLPDEIGNCGELQLLNLSENSLTGSLPSSISYLTKLEVLDISMNQLEGSVPGSYGQLFSLNRLSLGSNSFSGPIPSALGRCSRLQMLDLSRNQLDGSIPVEIFEIETLEIALNLSWNSLEGEIPPQIIALSKLSVLDLSHNKLHGDLTPLSGLVNLVSLNISYNNFTGYLPDTKLFRQLSASELAGNKGLCAHGRNLCFLSNIDGMRSPSGRRPLRLKLAISLLVIVTFALGVLGILAVIRVRRMKIEESDSELGSSTGVFTWKFTPFQKLNFSVDEVLRCLIEDNAIGKGCSGIVYRAKLDNGEVIAVKKLWPTTAHANYQDNRCVANDVRDSFSTEVRTLGSIRHKNIVKFLGCCWNENTRLLMYEYMPNGSLGRLLHEKSGNSCLEWETRYRVILGAAQGLAYLHHDCIPPIVHRDIKANNILIGLDFQAYIADFGLAKLVDGGNYAKFSNSLAGSYGYIAPEYGYMLKITDKSDVYSFGVVILEVLTGKHPTDPRLPDGLHIVDWVRRQRKRIREVLDPPLRARPEDEIDEMMQTFGVAMLCVHRSPEDRPSMKDVAAMLGEIRHEREELPKVADLVKSGNGGPSASVVNFPSGNWSFSASSLLHSDLSEVKAVTHK